jgi:hypothetical protein
MALAMSQRGYQEGTNPCRRNPKSVSRLKMAGRNEEEEVAERLRKPASGNVVDGVGTIDGT